MTDFRLDGKVVAVSGACGILGRAFSRALLDAGALVACLDLAEKDLDELRNGLEADSAQFAGYVCDIADPKAVQYTIDEVVSRFGRIDGLLNNAATKTDDIQAFLKPAEDYQPETWREVAGVNLDGQFYLAQAAGRCMLRQGSGAIIFLSSIYGVVGPSQSLYEGSEYNGQPISTPPAYSATKAGVIGLTRHLATSWGGRGVRVNCIVPGGVESGQNETFRARYASRVPLGRMAAPGDMAGPAIFLLSGAASYVNGAVLVVDGGFTAW